MSEEARASPRLKTLEFGILLGKEYGEYLEGINLSSNPDMLMALTKYELDWDYLKEIATDAGWEFDVQSYDEGVHENDDDEDSLSYEVHFTPLSPQSDDALNELMNQIVAQRIHINMLFVERFGFELYSEAEPDLRITCIPWEGFNDWNAPLCVAALASYLIERLNEARVRQELIRMLQTMSSTFADRTNLDQLKSIELLRTFLETHNYPGHKYGGAIVKLKDIQSLRSQIKPIHFTDRGFKSFVRKYELKDKLNPETKEGDFYALVHRVLEVALEALVELRQTMEEP